MPEDPPENRADDVRLVTRAVEDDDWITDFLTAEPMGVLGLVDEDSPYLVNQLFVYDDDERAIFMHGAFTGRTRTIVERDGPAPACFTASRMGDLIPAQMPVDFDVEYESVVAFGEVSLVTDTDEKFAALGAIMDTFAPHLSPDADYDPIAASSVDRTSVYRLDVEGWSAKRNVADEGQETYDYDAVRSGDR